MDSDEFLLDVASLGWSAARRSVYVMNDLVLSHIARQFSVF